MIVEIIEMSCLLFDSPCINYGEPMIANQDVRKNTEKIPKNNIKWDSSNATAFCSCQTSQTPACDIRNPSIYNICITLGCLDDGTNESSTKSLMFQFFFHTFIDLVHEKVVIFFCNFIKKIRK